MRIVPFILSLIVTVALIFLLDTRFTAKGNKTPRLGYFLSPQTGYLQNAENNDAAINMQLHIQGLHGNTNVYFNERLVPHVYADDENDIFFVQGYLHAKFRLWQMEFQTHAAAGRLSEIMGAQSGTTNFFEIDRFFRRLGMVYAAENSLKIIEANTETKAACDAYTAGVNNYISSLTKDEIPFEYKLLDYKPEPWTNMKTALFLKYMAYDLTGGDNDFEMTNAKSFFTKEQFEKLYPYGQDSVRPIFPKGILFAKPAIKLSIPADVDSLYLNYKQTVNVPAQPKPDPSNGSNNWAVSGIKTKSGKPILCNDPHLGLNLPSLWYEMQLSTPSYNVYGASFPGAPSIVIGFNDSCAWGVTNAERDVKDYYEIKFRDSTMKEYWYNNSWQTTTFRNEVIKIKGRSDHIEKIAMTVWGPVMYDKNYPDILNTGKAYACRWKAHDGSNDLNTFMALNKTKNFSDHLQALKTFECPGQNFVFATKSGDIAIKQQGAFPAKWKRQGDFIMEGLDDRYAWQANVPDSENLVLHNPEWGYVSSANQYPYDTTYPYYMGGSFEPYRGIIIKRMLSRMQNITAADMQHMQTSNYNLFAEISKPVLLKYLDETQLSGEEKRYLTMYKNWNLSNDGKEEGPSVFTPWWDSLVACIYDDELLQSKLPIPQVEHSTLLESLIKDSTYSFADDIATPEKETIATQVTKAFKKIIPVLRDAEKNNMLAWGKFKGSGIRHLLRIPALGKLDLFSGGGTHVINAYKKFNGPSWRMVVQLSDETEAYGIYPGGQSGNPGSKHYDEFINDWAAGKYYALHIYKKTFMQQHNIGVMLFNKN